jgi:acetyl esterase
VSQPTASGSRSPAPEHHLDPAVRRLIEEHPHGIPDHLAPAGQREYMFLLSELIFLRDGSPGPDVHSVEDIRIPVEAGTVLLRVYRPSDASPLPGHLTMHGGGWKLGSVNERVVDATCRRRCRDAHCVVISVDYRLAPEHRFPVPVDDCYAALVWAAGNAERLGLDIDNLSVGGMSAGANLAAAVTIRARDENGPRLGFQLLEVPTLDLTLDTVAATRASGVIPDVPQPTMEDATRSYLADPAQARNPWASPLLADDLSDLPAAHVMTAEYDVLRTEGERYAQRLAAAGVTVTQRRYPGALHGTAMLTRTWDGARQWQHDAAAALRQAHWSPRGPVPGRHGGHHSADPSPGASDIPAIA